MQTMVDAQHRTMSDTLAQPALQQVGKPLELVPVGLKEAALDSPTFRATAVHFADQVDVVEKWLEGYVKSTSKLVHEVSAVEDVVNSFLARSVPPANISEAVLDHDYTLLAMKRYGEGAREFWSYTISGVKKMEAMVVEPIRAFLNGELRNFRDARRYLDHSQKNFDNVLSRYAAQSKTKEASALREDAFQLYEARKSYIKASMDFGVLAPQVRCTIDKLLVRIFSDQWREMKKSREALSGSSGKWVPEMERVRGWSTEIESGERIFRRDLQSARKVFEEKASSACRPSRELEDYSISTIPFLGSKGPSTMNLQPTGTGGSERAEKQGWLFLRTVSGKPSRTLWVRRWFFVKNGIFGWLVQGTRTGGVEESERIGVLLCNVKAAFQEERRFCFEVKTKDNTILLQTETQGELTEWIESFEMAKRKALEDTTSTGSLSNGNQSKDAAFAISPPSVPEFAAKMSDSHGHHGSDELSSMGFERSTTLNIPESRENGGNLATRSSFDVASTRKAATWEKDSEGGRDHAARIIQKLDLHRKTTAGAQLSGSPLSGNPPAGSASGGIASLISASHNILPVYSAPNTGQAVSATSPANASSDVTIASITAASNQAAREVPASTLAPSTLANPPAPTNLSKAAVIVSADRGIGMEQSDRTGGMPSGLMANLWGSSNWGHINRLERGEFKTLLNARGFVSPSLQNSQSESPPKTDSLQGDEKQRLRGATLDSDKIVVDGAELERVRSSPTPVRHRKSISVETEAAKLQKPFASTEAYPANYPLQLRTQEAQFRTLFPNVSRDDKLLLVFRATWNPNNQQDFPGRVYVTANDIYFYSHHLGLVLISGVSLGSIEEVTAAPGKDCDFIFLHYKESVGDLGHTRITIKIFLDNLKLLQRRLNFLVRNYDSDEPQSLGALLTHLIRIETQDPTRSPSLESWEDVSINTPDDSSNMDQKHRNFRREKNLRRSLRVDQGLYDDTSPSRESKGVTKFKLPAQPIVHEPRGMTRKVVEKQFDISPKAFFHVLFGDKSAVFQILYRERRALHIKQGPWYRLDDGLMKRDFEYQMKFTKWLGKPSSTLVKDHQTIDILNDHLCYVVTDKKTPWHLPYRNNFALLTKIVITHVSKSKCKLAIYTHVEWSALPALLKDLIETQALSDLQHDALDLSDVLTDQVRRLGPRSRTGKVIQIFGLVGHSTEILHPFAPGDTVGSNDTRLLPSSMSSSPDARGRSLQTHTLTAMLLSTVLSYAETATSELISFAFALVRGAWKICNAHSLILSLLILSALTNLLLTSFHSRSWWHERRASRFMATLGVGPDTVMSKAVYLRDIDEISHAGFSSFPPASSATAATEAGAGAGAGAGAKDQDTHGSTTAATDTSNRKCYNTFLQLTTNPITTPHSSTSFSFSPSEAAAAAAAAEGGSSSTLASRAASKRLTRTRENLALYRHDLLVAMRVVNEIERSVLLAEWEDWVGRELRRCEQVGQMLAVLGANGHVQEDDPGGAANVGKMKKNEKKKTTAAVDDGGKDKDKDKPKDDEEGSSNSSSSSSSDDGDNGDREKKLEGLKSWYEEYCESCRQERLLL